MSAAELEELQKRTMKKRKAGEAQKRKDALVAAYAEWVFCLRDASPRQGVGPHL